MPALLTTERFTGEMRARVERTAQGLGLYLEPIALPAGGRRLGEAELGEIEIAFYPGDFTSDDGLTRAFLGGALRAPRLRWVQLPNAGVDHPVFARLLARGVRLATASGVAAEPIAQTVIGATLALARNFPAWWDAQRRHAWEPRNLHAPPPDLRGQTMVVVGLGAIGREVARLARALGLRVVGIRRSPRTGADPVDEVHPPGALHQQLRRADWLVLCCPLNDETRDLIDAAALALLPPGAHLLNVARGEVVDEAALIEALRAGRLAGAYLDVFREEPLPPGSPLWDLPNVIVSPHDSSLAAGNVERQTDLLLRNLEHLVRGEPLENEVHRSEEPPARRFP
jgi:phosphoglycerate dehydrogenase-like enzyme